MKVMQLNTPTGRKREWGFVVVVVVVSPLMGQKKISFIRGPEEEEN